MKNNYKCYNIAVLIPLLYIFFQLGTGKVYSQNNQNQQTISGIINDQDRLPLPGVNVLIKGSSTGTMSDMDGYYSLRASIGDTLVYSYVGYQTLEKELTPGFIGDLIMQPATDALSEVVINAGYYNTTERERTGNIARVTGKDIELQPVTSPIEALQGRMAGVSIVQRTGIPGTASQIQIRGQNSLRTTFENDGNLPLYIIDGVPIDSGPINSFSGMTTSSLTGIDPLNSLNLANIKSIEVLKDADATAIYGSRGANGVILITTKQGENFNQKTKINARISTGISEVSDFLDLLGTEDYIQLREEAFTNDGVSPTASNAEDLVLWNRNRETDWQEVLIGGTAETTNANINISGGNQTTAFQLSGGYFQTGTVFPGNFGYEKISTGISLNHKTKNNKLQLGLSINYGLDKNNQFNSANFLSGITLSPNAPELYNQVGSLNWENSSWTNPLAVTLNKSTATTRQLISSMRVLYKITKDIEFTTSAGYTMLDNNELVKNPVEAYDPEVRDRAAARSSHSFTDRSSWIIEPQLNYNRTFSNWNLNALIGTTFQQRKTQNLRMSAVGYADNHLVGNLAAADAVYVSNNQDILYRYNAIYTRLGLQFRKRYLLNLTGRRDGSSRFGPNKRFANFGAIGGAWIFSEENLLNNLSWLSFGKLRGSYGITGSDQIQDYGYLDTYSATPAPGGLYPTQLVNPEYSWETNNKLEFGFELGFWDDQLRFQWSWYRNRSSNQLVGYSLPSITGFNSVQANLPATVENTGLEIEGTATIHQSDKWSWVSSFNLTFPNNKLISFPGIEETSYANIYRVGEPLSTRILYRFQGVDPQTGLYTVEDVNDDGNYDYEDRIVNKSIERRAFGGLQNQLSYENFSINFLMEFVFQEGSKVYRTAPGRMSNVLQQDFDNRWQSAGDTGTFQKPSQLSASNRAYSNAFNSDFGISDASFLRLKSLNLSYNLPVARSQFQAISLYIQAQNLFTLTKYKGLDPQIPGSTVLPALRTITAGLDINI
ncbi:SusC/RagA family TonB-linked outer membrane protein [Zunongwangia sp. SCSIO 43204]|uniref:SusC/RagA family TonB-linked outer membrane protein n=1 Tax=Zunongwangia sp. SCSIO 43204 TaxID=2779359 RepID=UPI001CA9A8B3|nr:SusC/RagA family TonB-linked outer membrane protein [Zunongwangia sp. SCSIO 43204]UAB84851.1 SusC/RagA family TonB-linked outer membrane protein [Zunongwangia sp. SCSIO 43204]